MKIAIASEHAGFTLKEEIKAYLESIGLETGDLGAASPEPVDYPGIAEDVAVRVVGGEYRLGILICGTGTGMCLAAGKIFGARPALCTNEFMAEMARKHNDANILCLGSWITGSRLSIQITDAFIENNFDGGRHQRRVGMITELELKQKHS